MVKLFRAERKKNHINPRNPTSQVEAQIRNLHKQILSLQEIKLKAQPSQMSIARKNLSKKQNRAKINNHQANRNPHSKTKTINNTKTSTRKIKIIKNSIIAKTSSKQGLPLKIFHLNRLITKIFNLQRTQRRRNKRNTKLSLTLLRSPTYKRVAVGTEECVTSSENLNSGESSLPPKYRFQSPRYPRGFLLEFKKHIEVCK